MRKGQKVSLLLLRLATGWLFFYSGITKVLNPEWTAAGYLSNAQVFSGLFAWFAAPENIGWVNIANEWGLTLIGIALILGVYVRWASYAGIVLMTLYWLPIFSFPYVGEHSLIIDEHIIYASALLVLAATNAGRFWGLEGKIHKRK